MSGHSKWSKIKRAKGAEDAKRSKIFSKYSKEITVAVKEGGGDNPDFNPRLRLAIQNAKGANMPKDTIERAVKKGAEAGGDSYSEQTFEGYAPGGIAVFVECLTDNSNRTVAAVRSYFSKSGGSLATNGSVDFLFQRKGVFVIPKGELDLEELELELIDAGAEELELEDESITVTTDMSDYGAMQEKLAELGLEPESASLQRIPSTTTTLSLDDAKKVLRVIDLLEDDDDVQQVFHNMELTDEMIEELG